MRSMPLTAKGSFIATSNPPIFSSPSEGTPRFSTSASRKIFSRRLAQARIGISPPRISLTLTNNISPARAPLSEPWPTCLPSRFGPRNWTAAPTCFPWVLSSMIVRYKHREIDPQAVGRELNVRAVLTGKIMETRGSLRIGTELVDVATGSRLWGAQYNRKSGDILEVQDEISNEISGKLRLQLTRVEKKRLTKRHTENAEAYRLYLKGRHHWNRWTEEGSIRQSTTFNKRLRKTPAMLSPTRVWPIRMSSWDGTVIC